jgi:hypothetical protein
MASWLDTVTAPFKTARDMTTQFVEVRDAIKFGEFKTKLQAEIMAAYDAAMDMRQRETTLIDENATLIDEYRGQHAACVEDDQRWEARGA